MLARMRSRMPSSPFWLNTFCSAVLSLFSQSLSLGCMQAGAPLDASGAAVPCWVAAAPDGHLHLVDWGPRATCGAAGKELPTWMQAAAKKTGHYCPAGLAYQHHRQGC